MAKSPSATLEQNCIGDVFPAACCSFKIDWADDGFASEGTWTEEESYVLRAEWSLESSDLMKGYTISTGVLVNRAIITLDNSDGRFSPDKSGSMPDSNGGIRGKRMFLEVGRFNNGTPETMRQFTGYVKQYNEDERGHQITLTCYDRMDALLTLQGSTSLYVDTDVETYLQAVIDLLPSGERPTLTADRTLYPLPFCWLDNENGVYEFGLIAAAQGGVIYADTDGGINFYNVTDLLRGDSLTSQFTFDNSYWGNFTLSLSKEEQANRVECHVTPRFIGPSQEVWRLTEPWVIRPSSTRIEKVILPQPCYEYIVPTESNDFVAIRPSGVITEDVLTITLPSTQATRVQMDLANSSSTHPIVISELRLRGRPVLPREEILIEEGDDYGEPIMLNNPYIASRAQGRSLTRMYYARMQSQKRAAQLRNVQALPWLELRDRVTVTRYSADVDYFIAGLSGVYESGDILNSFQLMPADLYSETDWFIVGTSALGSGANGGKVFY